MQEKRNMVHMFRTEPGEVYETVDADKLKNMTCRGYLLMAVIYTDEVVAAHDYESRPVTDPNNTYSNRTETTSKQVSHVIRKPMFLMRLEADSALAQRTEEMETAKSAQAVAENARKEQEALATKLASEVKTLADKNAHAESVRKILDQDKVEERQRNRKLETDIAKIRGAIGELRMKEILGT